MKARSKITVMMKLKEYIRVRKVMELDNCTGRNKE